MGPDFQHKIVSDRFSAYEVLPLKQRGICWAQAVIFSASPGQAAGALGQALLNVSARVFVLRKRHLAGEISESTLLERLDVCRNELIKLLEEGAAMAEKGCGEKARTARTCQRILKLETALWRFLG